MSHELKQSRGVQPGVRDGAPQRPYWYCTCSIFVGGEGPGWVLYQTQPRGGGKPKPQQEEAERLHRRHIEDTEIAEEAWF